ncbi:ABC transporter substrate-binding protein [Butyrivibrio sp. AC2005]|uniref:ABC transporter substrate-binding protein n=1 Tax=Butyrivibrio sp. AC2005 TaxID=1280672 RepID=UPI0006775ACD|nr:ABC transporter substrate-binding protein [Butyrivibrio sp. AC2005]
MFHTQVMFLIDFMKNRKRRFELKVVAFFLLLFTVGLTGCGGISDGEYTASVSLTGGSGKAYIESPCKVTVSNKKAEADIIWSSSNYDYMIVDGNTYYPVNTEGNSEFIIPIEIDKDMEIQADTTAMSQPHLIDYKLRFELIDTKNQTDSDTENVDEGGESAEKTDADYSENLKNPPVAGNLQYLSTDENKYAECFVIHRYEDGYAIISVDDGNNYLVVPEGMTVPSGLGEDIIVLSKPLDRIYLAASGVMCQFDTLGETVKIILSGIEKDKWYVDSAREAMESGSMEYGGKYSAPDYEKMVMEDINLAVENTMILHTPKVLDKLKELGIPVFIDRCSYEKEPLGRLEWLKIYGLLTDKESEAEEAFKVQTDLVNNSDNSDAGDKTVVVFSINSNHMVSTKKRSDYFSKMIEMAGARYLGPDMEDDEKATSQVTVSVESFYQYASDADIIIYNSTIEETPESLESLMSTDITFKDFKAFKTGSVYYTDKSLYQFANKTGTIIDNLGDIISGEKDDTEFFHKLR